MVRNRLDVDWRCRPRVGDCRQLRSAKHWQFKQQSDRDKPAATFWIGAASKYPILLSEHSLWSMLRDKPYQTKFLFAEELEKEPGCGLYERRMTVAREARPAVN